MFLYNIVLSRFINWPPTLSAIGYQTTYEPKGLKEHLYAMMDEGLKVWGGAYVITTHGQKMSKIDYLVDQVLKDVYEACKTHTWAYQTCGTTSDWIQHIDGIGSFLAGQIVADLKNTVGHPLASAPDKDTFVVPGPGSMRGLEWFFFGGISNKVSEYYFSTRFPLVREYVDQHWPESVAPVDNQDLQNCLCEYDKYCRVATASGRSKRTYPGT